MNVLVQRAAAGAALLAAVACGDPSTATNSLGTAPTSAFATLPYGYDATQTTFNAAGSDSVPWRPDGDGDGGGGHHRDGHGHHRGRGGDDGLMGGGLGDDFLGGRGLGRGFGPGQFGDSAFAANCAYTAGTGRVDCAAVSRNGLTITRSFAFTNAGGAAQAAFDSLTTNAVDVRVAVNGTVTRRDGSTTTVDHASDRTVSGLAAGSSRHTVNGTSQGHETTTGTSSQSAFTAVRDVADTTDGLVIPVSDTGRSYPIAGRIVRTMQVTITHDGQAPQTHSRREEIVFDGSSTARITVTRDGTTTSCSIPLPFGHCGGCR